MLSNYGINWKGSSNNNKMFHLKELIKIAIFESLGFLKYLVWQLIQKERLKHGKVKFICK